MTISRPRIIAAALAGLTAVAGAAGAAPVLYGSPTQLQRYSSAPLSDEAGKTFRWLKTQDYFGAMFVDSVSGAAFAAKGYNNLQDAIAMAKTWCESERRGKCALYATLTPAGFNGTRSSSDGLSRKNAFFYQNDYLWKLRPGAYAAFAVSDMSQAGASWGWHSQAEAEGKAIAYCTTAVDKALAGERPAVREAVLHAQLTGCHIVDRRHGR